MDEDYVVAFQLITHAGDARSLAMRALKEARGSDFDGAEEVLVEARAAVKSAHQIQTDLVQGEARGERVPVNVILVHAQDHLATALLACELAEELIAMYRRLAAVESAVDAPAE